MISLIRLNRYISRAAVAINWIAAAAIVLMMLITTGDVVLRFLRISIPGAYETIGFLGALAIAFSLPYTAVEKGHIAVDFLVPHLPYPARIVIHSINSLVSLFLFSLIAWQSIVYAAALKVNNSVSPTLEMPIYPFVYGVAAGCILLCPVLLMELIFHIRGVEAK
jgi:TRAP-type C4-dicarboxylate transport system permease small subunit